MSGSSNPPGPEPIRVEIHGGIEVPIYSDSEPDAAGGAFADFVARRQERRTRFLFIAGVILLIAVLGSRVARLVGF